MDKENNVIKRNDLILLGAVILLGLAVILFMNISKTDGSQVRITVDGKEYKTLPLNKDTTFTVELENGEWNTFVIKDGYVDMIEASCPDMLCVKSSDIHFNHDTIVCLPNKVVLEVINAEDNEVDAVAN
jgi:hypothetical protein